MWEQIQYLGKRHDLTVVCFVSSQEEHNTHNTLADHCDPVMIMESRRTILSDRKDRRSLPWPLQQYCSIAMRNTLQELQSMNFDIVLIEQIFMAQYLDLISARAILQEHNIESGIFRQCAELRWGSSGEPLDQKERAFLQATWLHMMEYENRTWPTFALRTTVSENDKQELDRRCQSGRTVVIENGIGTESVTLLPASGSRTILFMGAMEYHPNVDAVLYLATSILPRIRHHDPSISLVIAGRKPPQSIRQLASDPRTQIYADPDDMSEIARTCCLTVVPLRIGGGTRIKILHSMAMGLPVVSTSLGCEGLSVVDGRHLLIRDEPDQFAKAVLQLISDPVLQNDLRTNGRKLVEQRYDWKPTFKKLEDEMLWLVQSPQ